MVCLLQQIKTFPFLKPYKVVCYQQKATKQVKNVNLLLFVSS